MKSKMRTVPCKSCKTPMIWVEMQSGKRMPLDASTEENRVVLDENGIGRMVPTWLSHYATCPDAEKFRKRKS